MFSNNPRSDLFQLQFDKRFFYKDICEKYDLYIRNQNGTFQNINQILHESIQSYKLTGWDMDPIMQETVNADGTINVTSYPTDKPPEKIIEDSTLTVTFRHLDTFINYFFLFESFYKKIRRSSNQSERFGITLIIYNIEGNPCFTMFFDQCFIINFPGFEFSYANPQTNFLNFDIKIAFSDMKTEFTMPLDNIVAYKPV